MKTVRYGIKQGLINIWQNRLFSLAAVGTIVTCLFVLGLFYMLTSNFQYMVYNAESAVGITVFFDEGLSQDKIEYIGSEIRACKTVEQVKFISAEEAWDNFKEEMYSEGEAIGDTFGEENPLKDSASYEVYLTDVSNQENIVHMIEKMEGVRKVNSSDAVASGLSSLNVLITYVSAAIIILLLMVSVFLISTAVAMGIRVRRDEISIMQYIGATDGFIKFPFVVEGIVIGIVGAAIPLIILWFLYGRMVEFALRHFSVLSRWLTFLEPLEEFRTLVPLSLLVGVGIGLAGSVLSVQRHLRA